MRKPEPTSRAPVPPHRRSRRRHLPLTGVTQLVDEWSEDYEYDDEPINERESMNRYAAAYSSCP